MKRTFLVLMLLAGLVYSAFAQSLSVYISDQDGQFTNVRNAPRGKVTDKIPASVDAILTVESPQNGWWKVSGGTYETVDGDVIRLKGSSKGCWVHSSVLCLGTRNYGGERLTLRQSPSAKSAVAYSFKEEILVRPVDIKGDWVKVKTSDGKHVGWIEAEWLCSNPVTNCC